MDQRAVSLHKAARFFDKTGIKKNFLSFFQRFCFDTRIRWKASGAFYFFLNQIITTK